MENKQEEKEVTLKLKTSDIHLLIMAIDCGWINFNNVQNVLTGVFHQNEGEKHTKDLLDKVTKVRQNLISQVTESLKNDGAENKSPKIITL